MVEATTVTVVVAGRENERLRKKATGLLLLSSDTDSEQQLKQEFRVGDLKPNLR